MMSEYYTLQEQHDHAVKYLDIMGLDLERSIYDQSETVMSYWLDEERAMMWHETTDDEPKVEEKRKWIEKTFGCKVYLVLGTPTDVGYLWSFLITTKYVEDPQVLYTNVDPIDPQYFVAFAYVWNETVEEYSELGSVGIRVLTNGAVIRVS